MFIMFGLLDKTTTFYLINLLPYMTVVIGNLYGE